MGENAAIFKLFDGFSRGKATAEIRLRFSNLLWAQARPWAASRLWHFRRATREIRHRLSRRV
jgi:hypothetical protein